MDLNFEESPSRFPQWLHHIVSLPTVHKASGSSTSLPTLKKKIFLIAILASMIFICILLIISEEHLFMYLLAICVSFFEKYLTKSSAYFNQVIGFFVTALYSSFYNLDMNPLAEKWLAIFSPVLQVAISRY